MAQLNYKADLNDTEQSFDVVPADRYKAVIEASDYVPTKAGTGKILKLTYQIIDGNFKGRKIFNNLNLENPNQQAVTISRQTLNGICKACNVTDLQDSSQLHDISMMIDVTVKEDTQYGMQNNIKKHVAIETKEVSTPDAPPSDRPAKQPWEK